MSRKTSDRRGTRLFAVTVGVVCLLMLQAGSANAGWRYYEGDGLQARSADRKARAAGHVKWYHGGFPYGYLHRGNYSFGSIVYATTRVGCIWARITYGFPRGDLTVGPGGPSGTISGGEYAGRGFYVRCRRAGESRPRPLRLWGVGYAKALLNSTTLQIATSRYRSQGPRFSSWEKNHYGDFFGRD